MRVSDGTDSKTWDAVTIPDMRSQTSLAKIAVGGGAFSVLDRVLYDTAFLDGGTRSR